VASSYVKDGTGLYLRDGHAALIKSDFKLKDIAVFADWDASLGVETSSGVAAADGQTVEYWRDQSGNGHDLRQATSGNRPTWQSMGFAGLIPSVRFASGSSTRLDSTEAASVWNGLHDGGFGWAAAIKTTAASPGGGIDQYIFATGNTTAARGVILQVIDATVSESFRQTAGASSPAWQQTLAAGSFVHGTIHTIVGSMYSATIQAGRMRVDGTSHLTTGQITGGTVFPSSGLNASATARVGGRPISNDTHFSGDIARLAIWDRSLTPAEINQIATYFKNLYGTP
jgi:hypothetical protein